MKRIFKLHYQSQWGQTAHISGSGEVLGNWDTGRAFAMRYEGNFLWTIEIEFPDNATLEYKYLIRHSDGQLSWEGGENRLLKPEWAETVEHYDEYREASDQERVLFSKVFTEVILKPETLYQQTVIPVLPRRLRFALFAPRVGKGFGMAVVGGHEQLGNWQKPLLMSNVHYPLWELELDAAGLEQNIPYKYVIVRLNDLSIATWEEGANRMLPAVIFSDDPLLTIICQEYFRYPVGLWKGAGLAVPVFSLRSNESFGVGEFNDLKKLVDWCVLTGLKMIQLLPVNETVATHSWLDSYPYKSISVMALHPMYLHLPALGTLNDQKLMKEFEKKRQELNQKPCVDYVEVTKAKSRYFKLIFDQEWERISKSDEYLRFFEENKEWLIPYAAFCFLRDHFKTSDFREWDGYAVYNPDQIAALTDPVQLFHEHIAVHYYIQFQLDQQLRKAVDYAHAKGIALKGDIPIGVSPNSIETWTEPALFNLNGQAGAPPDDFAIMGQNWGFPTYNWEMMEADGFAWWKKRLKMMEKYFDAYRIDHILGFFRIWEIPKHAVHGLLGYFKPGLPMTSTEIEDWGLWFDHERLARPYIRGYMLHDFFGEYADEVRRTYLIETEEDRYTLKPKFDTQQKIFAHFVTDGSNKKSNLKNSFIRDGLMSLLNEVLFVRDPYTPYPAWHPRIALYFTYSYRDLDEARKNALNDLYIHYYYKRHEEYWKYHALTKLPVLVGASRMLVCGEDLGMVPEVVPEVMRQLNILSLEIQRMPKNPRIEFGHPNQAPYLSVCTTSTHDMSTVRGWWEEDKAKTQRFYQRILGHNDEAPFFAEPWVCFEIIRQHLHSPAMWTIFPIQDLLAMDGALRWEQTDEERINVPSNPENKWRYRMALSLDELCKADEFNQLLKGMIHLSGRDADY
ncbi:MAG: 4-alpha-glucanotransferase [Bacteroidales bacterium]|nr:4-alpha-glucanotransferase [Bacteroidales bacterium]